MQSPPPGMAKCPALVQAGTAWLGSSSADEELGLLADMRLNTSLSPEQSQQGISSKLVLPFLTQCFAVLKAQTMSHEVLMQLLDLAVAEMWSPLAFAISPVGMTDHSESTA